MAIMTLSSCREDEAYTSTQYSTASKISVSSNAQRMHETGATTFIYGNSTFVSGENSGLAYYELGDWQNDINLSNHDNYTVVDDINGSVEIKFIHNNGVDIITLTNIHENLDGSSTFDVATSSGQYITDVTVNQKISPVIWEILITIAIWIIDHTTTTEGGTQGECAGQLAACPNGGMYTFSSTTGWFGSSTTCSLTCYP